MRYTLYANFFSALSFARPRWRMMRTKPGETPNSRATSAVVRPPAVHASKIARVRPEQRHPDTARARALTRIAASSRASTICYTTDGTAISIPSSSTVASRQRAFARRW